MSFSLNEADFGKLVKHFPDLDLDHPQRKAVLLSGKSVDVQAAPGSGKTTLLGAKLALLASTWTEQRRGICVLSHTNVARAEIEGRLAKIHGGLALLQYPHYIGTIQSFIHTFLALPLLRSRELPVEFVDDDRFTKLAVARGYRNQRILAWAKSPNQTNQKTLETLRFEGPDLTVGSAAGPIPKTGTTRPELIELKQELAAEGYYRYDDMYAMAQHVLAKWPSTSRHLSWRFPLVFIDEMQDTGRLADKVLGEVFDESVVVQRFGDVNQAILDSDVGGGKGFPRHGYLNVSGSMRFGRAIADVVSALRTEGDAIDGLGAAAVVPPTLLVYSEATIGRVIPHFGELVAASFSAAELAAGTVKAICARRTPMANPRVGSSVDQYWQAYVHQDASLQPTRQTIAQLLAAAQMVPMVTSQLAPRVQAVRAALVRLLRIAGCEAAQSVRGWRELKEHWGPGHPAIARLTEIVMVCVRVGGPLDAAALTTLVNRVCADMKPWLPSGLTLPWLLSTNELQLSTALGGAAPVSAGSFNEHIVVASGKEFPVSITTIASAKGETHLATLVLEAFRQSSFDIASVLPVLSGERKAADVVDAVGRGHVKNMFVALSRPQRLLCLAAYEKRVGTYADKLAKLGWRVHVL